MHLSQAKQYFNQLLLRGQLSHAYLLSGDLVEGKQQLIDYLTQALVCENFKSQGRACLECRDCQRVAAGKFVDQLIIQPDGRSIRVDQIRALKDWLATSPMEANFKFAVIEHADLMNEAAANALLLFLEEPGENVYIFLLSRQADSLLPTIISRVQELVLEVEDPRARGNQLEAEGILAGHAPVLLLFASSHIEGWIQDYQAEAFEEWLKALEYFYQLLMMGQTTAFVCIQQYLKKDLSFPRGQDGLDYLLWINSQLLLDNFQAKTPLHQALSQRIEALQLKMKERVSLNQFYKANQVILNSKELLKANVTPQLAYEKLAIELCQWQ